MLAGEGIGAEVLLEGDTNRTYVRVVIARSALQSIEHLGCVVGADRMLRQASTAQGEEVLDVGFPSFGPSGVEKSLQPALFLGSVPSVLNVTKKHFTRARFLRICRLKLLFCTVIVCIRADS